MDQNKKSDNELMQEFSTCSLPAYKEIVNRYKKRLFNYLLLGLLKGRDNAEDVVQETLITVFKSKFTYKPTHQFSTWIYTVCRNLALNEKRKKKTIDFDTAYNGGEPSNYGDSVIENIIEEENSQIIKQVLLGLQNKYREILILRFYRELSYEEISKITGIKINTLKAHCKRALEKMRKEMEMIVEK